MNEVTSPVSMIIKNALSGERTLTFSQDAIVIGRSAECDVVLSDPGRNISGRHALIYRIDSGYILKDTSRNGTRRHTGSMLSNGMSVPLSDGDQFEIVGYKFVFIKNDKKINSLDTSLPTSDINTTLSDLVGVSSEARKVSPVHLPPETVVFETYPSFSKNSDSKINREIFSDILTHAASEFSSLMPSDAGSEPEHLMQIIQPEQGAVQTHEKKTVVQLHDDGQSSETMRSVAAVCLTLHSLFEKQDDSAKHPDFRILHRFLRGEPIEGGALVSAIQSSCDEIVRAERAHQSVIMEAFRHALSFMLPDGIKARASGILGRRFFRSEKALLWRFFENQSTEISNAAEHEFIRHLNQENEMGTSTVRQKKRMLGRLVGFVVPLFLLGSLSACGGPSPTRLDLKIETTAQVNPNAKNRPSPVVIRVFNLTNDEEFQAASFDALYGNDPKSIDSSILGSDEYEIAPSSSRHLVETLPDGTKAIGLIAAFREIDHAKWRLVIPLRLNRKNNAGVIVGPSTIFIKKKR